jgi:tRNA dimethylallyltransferase
LGRVGRGRIAAALVVIGGSTASGKSALALALARRTGGTVINADSQQLFADLPVLTARPGPDETVAAPHRLYGVLAADEQPSVGRWLALVAPALAEACRRAAPAIVVGGTGLYLHALLHGMPEMPDVPAALRAELRAWAEHAPPEALHARLRDRDPELAARLRLGDRQRALRGLEVIEATGRSLLAWQRDPRRRLPLPERVVGVALVPAAGVVGLRIEARLAAMLGAGALGEVEDLLRRHPDATALPVAKVHGLRELAAVSRGRLAREAAAAAIAVQVRRYAKRQRTWFRHQLPELRPFEEVGESPEVVALAAGMLERLVAAGGVDLPGPAH